MRDGINTGMLTSVIVMTALLSACSVTSYNQVTSDSIDKVAEQSKLRIDWSKIDSDPKVLKDNRPRDIIYPRSTIDLAKAVNRPVADIYRHLTVYDSPEVEQVLDQIKTQLGESYVDIYGNADGKPKYFIVTRQNVMANSYEYVIKTGEAKGFSIDFEILPIADRTEAEMRALYQNESNLDKIEQILAKKGATLTAIAYTPEGFKINLSIRYSPYKLSESEFVQLENEISDLLSVNVYIERRSVSIKPL